MDENKKKRYYILISVFTGAAVLGIVVICLLLGQTHRLRSEIQNLQTNISEMQRNLQSSIDSGIGNIEASLKEQSHIFSYSSCETGNFDREGKKLNISMTATPKSAKEGAQVTFLLMYDGQQQKVMPKAQQDSDLGLVFTAEGQIPLCENLVVMGVLQQGDEKQTQTIGEFYNLQGEYLLTLESASYWGSTEFDPVHQQLTLDGSFEVFMYLPDPYGDNQVEKAELVIQVNGSDAKVYPIQVTEEMLMGVSLEIPVKENLDVQTDDMITVLLRADDTYGYHYERIFDAYSLQPDGSLSSHPELFSKGETQIS